MRLLIVTLATLFLPACGNSAVKDFRGYEYYAFISLEEDGTVSRLRISNVDDVDCAWMPEDVRRNSLDGRVFDFEDGVLTTHEIRRGVAKSVTAADSADFEIVERGDDWASVLLTGVDIPDGEYFGEICD